MKNLERLSGLFGRMAQKGGQLFCKFIQKGCPPYRIGTISSWSQFAPLLNDCQDLPEAEDLKWLMRKKGLPTPNLRKLHLPKKDDSPQGAQRKFEVKQGTTPRSLLYSVHSLSDNNTIFWLTYLLHESTEKRLILFCILNMKIFSAFSVV